MRRLLNAIAALVLAAGVSAAMIATTPTAALADDRRGSPGFCPDGDGVTVVVDFQELGGDRIVRCAPGDQETGLAALKNAGISIAGTNRWGEAFICRIENKPGPAAEPCIDTPPASAYWSYWHSPNNGDWTYSQWGVTNRKPPLGSFEGWSFSKDKTEDTNPPPGIAPSRPDSGDSGSGSQGGSSNGSGGERDSEGSGGDKSQDDKAAATDEEPAPGPNDLPSEAPGWTGEGADGMRPASAIGISGIPASTLVGIAVVVVLGGAGGVVALKRALRRAEETS